MSSEDFAFAAYQTRIFGQYIAPKVVKGVVVLVHGLGEHSGRYTEIVVPMLTDLGLAVMPYDNIGHGKSGGKRGHCPGYEPLLNVLNKIVLNARARYHGLPIFLYGHSMGGNLVLNYALRRNIKLSGVVATSPYLRLAFRPPQWKVILGRLMLTVFPSITLPSGLDPQGISRVPEEVEAYKSDALVHDKVSPMYSFPVMDAGEWAIAHAGQLNVDTLLLHGTADPITDYHGTEKFHKNSKTTVLRLFSGGFHELHHDLCATEMLNAICEWLQSRL